MRTCLGSSKAVFNIITGRDENNGAGGFFFTGGNKIVLLCKVLYLVVGLFEFYAQIVAQQRFILCNINQLIYDFNLVGV
jgi:hypothetical protein